MYHVPYTGPTLQKCGKWNFATPGERNINVFWYNRRIQTGHEESIKPILDLRQIDSIHSLLKSNLILPLTSVIAPNFNLRIIFRLVC